MRWSRLLLPLLFGGVFLGGLLLFAPAAVMATLLERSTAGRISLAQTSGSFWQGSGVLIMHSKSTSHTLGLHHWRWRPDASLEVRKGDNVPMAVSLSPLAGRVDISQLNLTLPTVLLEALAPQLGPYQLQGVLTARSEHLTLQQDGLHGPLSIDWHQAASRLSPVRPLGDYRIVLQGNGSTLNAQLSTLSGKLQLSAQGQLLPGGHLQINGTAQASPEAKDELNELLHYIGPEQSPGVYTLALVPQ